MLLSKKKKNEDPMIFNKIGIRSDESKQIVGVTKRQVIVGFKFVIVAFRLPDTAVQIA